MDTDMRHVSKSAGILLVIVLVIPRALSAQNDPPSPSSNSSIDYPNTVDGLNQLLQDVRDAAKRGDKQTLATFIKNMEIPNCEAWLHEMYASDKADSWMSLCEEKSLAPREKAMGETFEQLAGIDRTFVVRKVNDSPSQATDMESGWLQTIRKPLNI